MNNTQIYDNFLELKEITGKNEEFDFNFNVNKNKKEFEQEYLKFISLYNYFFFDTQRKAIATVFNSYPCALDNKTIEHLNKLYAKAKTLNKNIYIQLIAEFLFSYKKSLETEKYKKELEQDKLREYKGILYRNFPRNNFGPKGEIFKHTIKFYKNIVNYAIRKNQSIGFDQKIRMLSKFEKNQRMEKEYIEIFDYILREDKSLSELVKYDYNIKTHLTQYKSKILNSTENSYLSEESVEIFKELVENVENQEDFIKAFINKYIILCNELIKKVMLKEDNSILAISNFEQIVKELNKIKSTNISNNFKEKINECICKILCIKRKILSDTEYINSNLHEYNFEFKVPNKKIDAMHNDILNSFAKIYPYAKIDFNEMVSQSIKSYSEHPMLYLITNITIGNNELYYMNESRKTNNAFKNYYDVKGKEYINKNAKKLINLLEKDYYENMLKYTKTEFNFKIGLIASVLYKDIEKIKHSIDLARLDENTKNDNLYIEMTTQIIGIEVNIYKLLKINDIKPEESIEKNLELLFERYIENKFYRNAIMNIYYILYCEQGEHLRSDIIHGNLLSQQNYVRELIMIYACMIVINFMVSDAKNETN